MGLAIAGSLDLAAVLGKLDDTLTRLDGTLSELERPGKKGVENRIISPVTKKLFASIRTPASALTYTFIDCNPYGVPKGYVWDVRRVAVSGPDPFTAVTGAAFPFVAAQPPFDSNTEPANFPDLIDVATTTIPNLSFWGTGQVMLVGGEHLIIATKGLPNATTINVSYQILEFLESDLATWSGR